MIRPLAGLAAGLGVAIVTMVSVEAVGNRLFPPPAGYDLSQGSALSLPFETLVWPVIGWLLGALAGSWVALRASGQRWPAWVVTVCVLAASLLNLALIRHPAWMITAGVLTPLFGGWLGQQIEIRTRRSRA